MAFSYTVEGRTLLPPANKRYNDQGTLELVWGTFTNSGGGTGGEIKTGSDDVLHANASDSTGAAAIRIQPNISAAGNFTITTTADHVGTWSAIVKRNSK